MKPEQYRRTASEEITFTREEVIDDMRSYVDKGGAAHLDVSTRSGDINLNTIGTTEIELWTKFRSGTLSKIDIQEFDQSIKDMRHALMQEKLELELQKRRIIVGKNKEQNGPLTQGNVDDLSANSRIGELDERLKGLETATNISAFVKNLVTSISLAQQFSDKEQSQ